MKKKPRIFWTEMMFVVDGKKKRENKSTKKNSGNFFGKNRGAG